MGHEPASSVPIAEKRAEELADTRLSGIIEFDQVCLVPSHGRVIAGSESVF